jgi:hypothetical protein
MEVSQDQPATPNGSGGERSQAISSGAEAVMLLLEREIGEATRILREEVTRCQKLLAEQASRSKLDSECQTDLVRSVF